MWLSHAFVWSATITLFGKEPFIGMLTHEVRIQDLCKGGGKQDFADITQWSPRGSKNLGLKIEGRGGGGRAGPRAPLDPHLRYIL